MPSYAVRRVLDVPPGRLFDLVADVERYPEFVPWWVAARITGREGDAYCTDQVVRVALLRQRFSTRTVLCPPKRIDVTSADRAFRSLHIAWSFEPTPQGGCEVGLTMTIELRSRVAQEMAAALFAGAPARLVAAFEARARQADRTSG